MEFIASGKKVQVDHELYWGLRRQGFVGLGFTWGFRCVGLGFRILCDRNVLFQKLQSLTTRPSCLGPIPET